MNWSRVIASEIKKHIEKPARCAVFSSTHKHTSLKHTQNFTRAFAILRKKVNLSHVIVKVFAHSSERIHWSCVYFTVSCVRVNISLHAALTPYIKQLQGPQSAIVSPLDCKVVLEEYKMASQSGEFSWHPPCCWDSYQSLSQQYGWEGWNQRQRYSLWFSAYFRLLITHHGSEKLSTKLTLVSRCTKNYSYLFLISGRGVFLRIRGFVCLKYCRAKHEFLFQREDTAQSVSGSQITLQFIDTRCYNWDQNVMFENPIDLSWVSRRQIMPKNGQKIWLHRIFF